MKKTDLVKHDKLAGFLYDLMRDHMPVGVVEAIVRNQPEIATGNFQSHLVDLSKDLAKQLRSGS